jgi:hypothetical protein
MHEPEGPFPDRVNAVLPYTRCYHIRGATYKARFQQRLASIDFRYFTTNFKVMLSKTHVTIVFILRQG